MTEASQKPSALVVEDDPPEREELTRILHEEGFQVKGVRSGREALDALRTGSYDLVVLDILLPVMDGFDVMKQLKEIAPEVLQRTIVVSRLDVRDMKVFFPVSRVFSKPVDEGELREAARLARDAAPR
jgi:DNA-binding response OmpR family regulator